MVDSRFRQGGVVTAEVAGQLEFELSLGTFDLFLSALAFCGRINAVTVVVVRVSH